MNRFSASFRSSLPDPDPARSGPEPVRARSAARPARARRLLQRGLAALVLGSLSHGIVAQTPCQTSQVVLNTGYDHINQTALAIGDIDARWTVVADPTPNTTEPRPATVIQKHFAWMNPEPGSQWISGYPTSSQTLNGTYVFETTFCLRPEADLAQCSLQIGMRADDACTAYLNGSLIHTGQAFGAPTLTIGNYALNTFGVIGSNTLRIEVDNTGNVAMGLDLVATVFAAPNGAAEKPECCSGTGSLQGLKYHDVNGNGVRDFGEPALAGWQINLRMDNSAGTLVSSVLTDGEGYYNFTGVQPGSYKIEEVQQAGWVQTAPSSGVHTVGLAPLQGIHGLDFGNQLTCTAAPSFMVGWWDGSGGGGTVTDLAGPVLNHGTWMGGLPLPTTGYVSSNGLRHAGSRWVNVPDHKLLNFREKQSFSIDLWAKPSTGASVGLQPLVCKTWNELALMHEIGYAFYLDNGHPALLLADGNFSGNGMGLQAYVATNLNMAVPENAWTFLAVTVDRGSTPLITFYVNGVTQTAVPITASLSHQPLTDQFGIAVDLRIGAFANNFVTWAGGVFGSPAFGTNIFNGETDEVELFRRRLNPSEVARIFAAGPQGKCKSQPYSWDPSRVDYAAGSLVGDAKDALYPFQPTNPTVFGPIHWPWVHIATNGFVYLATSSTPPGSATGFGAAGAMVTNLRNGPVRVAPFWGNLDLQVANGGVYVNEISNPDCLVITWKNAVEVGSTTPKTFQCQLFASGEIVFVYDGAMAAEGTNVLVGVAAGGGIADPGASDFSAGSFGGTAIAYENFDLASPFDLGDRVLSWLPDGAGFDVLADELERQGTVAYGTGCYQRRSSFYQWFGDSATAAATLQGQGMMMVPGADGYYASWIPGGAAAFVPPSPSATVLAVSDEGEAAITSSLPLPTPFGAGSQLHVHANGVISIGAAPQTFPGLLPPWVPNPEGMLGAASTAFWCWHDFNPGEPGSGALKYEEVGTMLFVTWDDVENFAVPETANRSTVQCQLDLATGIVTWVWPQLDANTTSNWGSGYLVGFSPGGPSLDPGDTQLATALPLATGPDDAGLRLSVAPTPRPGSVLTLTTANIPQLAPFSGVYASFDFIGFSQVPAPGLDLAFLGAPGCPLLLGSLDIITSLAVGASPVQDVALPIPVSTSVGLQFFVQSAALAQDVNAFGLVTSNGVACTVR